MSQMLNGKRVLIVDDDPIFCEIAETRLTKCGADVVTLPDGAEALEYFEKSRCDLAVVDLIMPKVDGLRLISILRHMPQGRQLPIVVVTSRRDAKARYDAEKCHVDLFLNKPIRWTAFTEALCGVLSRRAIQTAPVRAA